MGIWGLLGFRVEQKPVGLVELLDVRVRLVQQPLHPPTTQRPLAQSQFAKNAQEPCPIDAISGVY